MFLSDVKVVSRGFNEFRKLVLLPGRDAHAAQKHILSRARRFFRARVDFYCAERLEFAFIRFAGDFCHKQGEIRNVFRSCVVLYSHSLLLLKPSFLRLAVYSLPPPYARLQFEYLIHLEH
jgi:hypothetical protein